MRPSFQRPPPLPWFIQFQVKIAKGKVATEISYSGHTPLHEGLSCPFADIFPAFLLFLSLIIILNKSHNFHKFLPYTCSYPMYVYYPVLHFAVLLLEKENRVDWVKLGMINAK